MIRVEKIRKDLKRVVTFQKDAKPEAGMATVEFALSLPAVVFVILLVISVAFASSMKIHTCDIARHTARIASTESALQVAPVISNTVSHKNPTNDTQRNQSIASSGSASSFEMSHVAVSNGVSGSSQWNITTETTRSEQWIHVRATADIPGLTDILPHVVECEATALSED